MKTSPCRPKQTLALRGPLSQQRFDQLGYEVPDIVGDPGLCLPLYYRPHQIDKKYKLGVVPHGFDLDAWKKVPSSPDVTLINVDRNVEEVVDDILECEKIASSSLHGIIVAHAYGIPACWIQPLESKLIGDDTKFLDYFRSVELSVHKPISITGNATDYLVKQRETYSTAPRDLTKMAKALMEACPFNAIKAQLEMFDLER